MKSSLGKGIFHAQKDLFSAFIGVSVVTNTTRSSPVPRKSSLFRTKISAKPLLLLLLLLHSICNEYLYESTKHHQPLGYWYISPVHGSTLNDYTISEAELQARQDARQLPPCKMGYFECDDSEFCVKQNYICDNVPDCLDFSDELNCTDNTRAHYFNKLFSKRPDEDREKQLTNCSLDFVPNKCTCSNANIYCVGVELKRVPRPSQMPPGIVELDLSGNHLEKIHGDSFKSRKFHQLQSLIMTKSEIVRIETSAFQNLTELTYLNLIGNMIANFTDGTFRHNRNLKLLYLSHNQFDYLNATWFEGLKNLVELYCKLTVIEYGTFSKMPNLEILWLQRNRIYHLDPDSFSYLTNLDTLSLSFNRLRLLDSGLFWNIKNLKSLSLSYNELSSVNPLSLEELAALEKLDLSHNQIDLLDRNTFSQMVNLVSLDLRQNRLKKLPNGIFANQSSLTYIYFDDFKMCSYAPNVRVCHPRGDGISSVQHLLDNIILRVSVWIVALIACVGNISVLIGRMLVQELNEVHSFFIKNLALADFLMGIYLFVIAYYDVLFRNEYIRHEEHWRASWQCRFSGVISTMSSESSVLILVFITADRYFSVMYPFSMKRRKMTYAILAMFLVWILSVVIAVIPLLAKGWFGDEFYGSNGVCLALQIHETFSLGWEYSTLIFCGLNTLAFAFIAYAYLKMSLTIMSSGIGLRTTQQQQDRNIAKRCGFIVATDGLCWLPIVVIKIVALMGIPINQDLYAWVAIFLLPVNSALNPVLYTLTTKMFKQHLNRIISNQFSSYYHHRQASNACENSNSSFCSINLNHSLNNHTDTTQGGAGGTLGSKYNSQTSIYRKASSALSQKFMSIFTSQTKLDKLDPTLHPITEPPNGTLSGDHDIDDDGGLSMHSLKTTSSAAAIKPMANHSNHINNNNHNHHNSNNHLNNHDNSDPDSDSNNNNSTNDANSKPNNKHSNHKQNKHNH